MDLCCHVREDTLIGFKTFACKLSEICTDILNVSIMFVCGYEISEGRHSFG